MRMASISTFIYILGGKGSNTGDQGVFALQLKLLYTKKVKETQPFLKELWIK